MWTKWAWVFCVIHCHHVTVDYLTPLVYDAWTKYDEPAGTDAQLPFDWRIP